MNREEDTAVQFLIGLGIFTEEDAKLVREAQIEPIIRVMVKKQMLCLGDTNKARELIRELLGTANHIQRLRTQMALIKLITGKMHERMATSGDKIREHRERVTSGNYQAVPMLAKTSGD